MVAAALQPSMEQDWSVISHKQYLFSYSLIQKVFLGVLLKRVYKPSAKRNYGKNDCTFENLGISPPEPNFAFPRTYISAHTILERSYVFAFFIFSFSMQIPSFS